MLFSDGSMLLADRAEEGGIISISRTQFQELAAIMSRLQKAEVIDA